MRAYYLPDSLLFYVLLMVAQTVKNPPAMQETWVQSLGREDPLEKEWQPTPVFCPGEFLGQRSLAGYSPLGHKELDTTGRLSLTLSLRSHLRAIKSESLSQGFGIGLME